MTPLQIALAKSDVALVKLLLQNKADANSKSHEESSWASPPNPLTRWALVNPEMLKLFLEAGADANAEAWSDWSLLSAAASRGRAEAVELLLKHGAKPDVFDSEGETPLSRAAGKDCVTCVQALLRFKANPNFRTKVGGTPLLSAVAAGFATNVATLLNAGADPNMSYDNGWAPVHGAVWDWRWEILEMLLAKGANPNVRSGHYGSPLDLIKQPTSGRRTPGQGPTEPGAELFAALLRKNGAMDDLPDFNSIGVSRASSGHRATVFMLGTNRWNRFTLTELIAKQLGLLSTEFASRWTRKSDSRLTLWNGSPIRFPDFSRITIHRPTADGNRRMQIPVNFTPGTDASGKRTDLELQPGDVVEIPEADHPVSEFWPGPTAGELQAWTNALARVVTLVIAGQSTELRLTTEVEIFTQSQPERVIMTPASFMIRAVLDQSRLVRFSSDLTRVKVTRQKGADGRAQSWVVDCSGKSALPDLWLQDGDEIEVPDKP
jgi:ankyrin repeat protein